MKNRGILIVVVLLLAAGGFWLWKRRATTETPATSSATQTGSGSAARAEVKTALDDAGTASVTITVSSDKGPIADATVRLAPDDGDVIVVRTDKAGVARADKLALGDWDISASAPGFVPAALASQELVKDEAANLEVTLVAGGVSLTGTVTDATGGPVASARIDVAKLGGDRIALPSNAIATTVTQADGTYKLTVHEGQLLVAAASPDYAAQARHIEVGSIGAVADFSLVPGGVIEGIVRDERTKQPVAGARITARRDGGGMMMFAEGGRFRARSNVDGRFRLTGLRPGAYELDARADKLVTRAPTVVGIGVAEQVTDVELLVGVGLVVSGVVVDENDKPVADANVFAGASRREERGASETSDANGAFSFVGLAPGAYHLSGSGAAHVPHGAAQVDLVDKDVAGVNVRVRKGLQITGHVEPRQICTITHDPAGNAFGEITTLAAPRTTEANGEFTIGPTSPAKAKLTARCPSGAQGSREIDPKVGAAAIVIDVKPGASIAGKVIDGKGNPIAGATVMAAPDGAERRVMVVNGMVTSGMQAMTDAQGVYEIVGLSAGPYKMSALERGRPLRTRGTPPRVTLGATEHKKGVDLAVDRPDGVIRGVVTGPDGKPLADAWVSVHQDLGSLLEGVMRDRGERDEPESSTMMITATSDEDGDAAVFPPALTDATGTFEIRGLPHAKYEVVAEAKAGALRGRAPGVTPDATIAIQAVGLTSLSGTVTGANGPAAVFSIELDGPTTAARTFTDGKFQFGRVDPGSYTLRVSSKDGNATVKVDVVANQPATTAITLVANAIVVGKLVDSEGKPVTGVGVVVVADQGEGKTSISLEGMPPTTGPDGSFRIESPARASVLLLMTPPRPITKRPLALEAGKTLDVGTIRMDGKGSAAPPP